MKKLHAILAAGIAGLVVGLVALAAVDPTHGWGPTQNITTATTFTEFSPPATTVSVWNQGTATVYAQVNVTTAQFAAAISGTNAISIPANGIYLFKPLGGANTLCLKSASGTNAVTAAAQISPIANQ